ncbi:MAG: poly-gamma-glutamate synthase PgsB [Armatimonadota bacterium]|nr:poly-gamma-glutamate synthase PgsB [Armatimonadota bacterium]
MTVVLGALGLLAAEGWAYRRTLRRIRWRVHVNGTRGKSTVTRLIAAGLRAGGLRVVAKTTGSAARIICEDGAEMAVRRPGGATISEQRRFVRWAAARGVDAIVVECMAVRPEYQRVSEDYLIQAHVGVITNVRLDHGEDLDPTPAAVARGFAEAVPRRGVVVTLPSPHLEIIARSAARRRCRLVVVPPVASENDPFPENVALALEVCRQLGVDADVALVGMRAMRPDPGAAGVYAIRLAGWAVTCVNAFAANDPESTRLILQRLGTPLDRPVVVVYNHRADRPARAVFFTHFFVDLAPAHVLLVGGHAKALARRWAARRIPVRVVPAARPEEVMGVARMLGARTVIGVGNIAGMGMRLVRLWEAARD